MLAAKPTDNSVISGSEANSLWATDPRWLRLGLWFLVVVLGLIQTWFNRHLIFSDGVSYLDIADYYLAGNWHAALNSYWSPLYSWLLALFLVILRPSDYWRISVLHIVNLVAYLAAAIGFEFFLRELIRASRETLAQFRLSLLTMRLVGYACFLLGTFLLVDIGYVSPDMVSTAILMFVAYLMLRVQGGTARTGVYLALGILLGAEYLARAAFASFIPFYLLIVAVVVWERDFRTGQKTNFFRPLATSALAAVLVAAPFVVALSASKGRFTLGDAGKLNYGWEVDGAARSAFWLGEPGDIGRPIHPPKLVLSHPRVFTFATPVPGTYPPWYEPSYWYQGIQPHLKWKPQLRVIRSDLKLDIFLFLRSPASIPLCFLALLMGVRRWLSRDGILRYWFLLIPALAFIAGFTLVFVDPRYIGGSLVVIWCCGLASIALLSPKVRSWANWGLQILALLTLAWLVLVHYRLPIAWALSDLKHGREADWNLQSMIADAMKKAGLRPGDRIAWIGEPINGEWVSMDHARVIAEVGVRWDRFEDTLLRSIDTNQQQVKEYWASSPAVKAEVLEVFRREGAKFVMADKLPKNADTAGWHQLFPQGTAHLPAHSNQLAQYSTTAYLRLQ